MKAKKKHKNKLKAIKKHIENFPGVGTESYGNRIRKTIGFEVFDHEDITSSISALLEVCYYALDGNGTFVYPKHSNKTPISSVTKVLEMVIDLLPHDQMFCLDKISEILSEQGIKKK
ncbi:hypothetical protein EV196_103251 [Mariniflexile fucanivorans]|uniref:Uncharacterized protein n=1 Tax=Mariniflexile fucanivorans TaxID=264023 RepID=A0A4R1RM15_9FLAO|nr:hypothetical protein [Mariniflexile fucanivorans]TCL66832.1 hypothetical protein EV196_103251 [Mariniflexile fucanivorans]